MILIQVANFYRARRIRADAQKQVDAAKEKYLRLKREIRNEEKAVSVLEDKPEIPIADEIPPSVKAAIPPESNTQNLPPYPPHPSS
jgi:hypothetical protein